MSEKKHFDPNNLKFVKESEIPRRAMKKSEEWLHVFQKIPQGEALVLKEEELDVKAITITYLVGKLKRIGALPSNFKAMRRKTKGKVVVYIVNSAEEEKEQKEAS